MLSISNPFAHEASLCGSSITTTKTGENKQIQLTTVLSCRQKEAHIKRSNYTVKLFES